MSRADAAAVRSSYKDLLTSELDTATSSAPSSPTLVESDWARQGIVWPGSGEAQADPATGVDAKTLQEVGRASVFVPEGFVCDSPHLLTYARLK